MIDRIGIAGSNPYQLPIASAVRAGDFIFASGQAGLEADGTIVAGGIRAETAKTIERLLDILAAAGCAWSDVVKATVWLDDPRDFGALNDIFAQYFGEHPPTRSTLVSPLVIDGKVEVEVIAYRPLGSD